MNVVALVTGAASGIGRHLTTRLLASGARALATDLDLAALEKAARDDAWPADRVRLLRLDVRDPAAWKVAVDSCVAAFSRLDVLLNVAGFLQPGYVRDLTDADVDLHLDVNVKGVVHGTRAAIPQMEAQGRGHIVNIASMAALAPVPGLSLYCASKFAVRGFSLSAAHELAPRGIAVTVVCPDAVQTPMLDKQRPYAEAALTFSGPAPLTVDDLGRLLMVRVLPDRPLEVVLPLSRGILAKLAGAIPRIGFWVAPMLLKKGRAAQKR